MPVLSPSMSSLTNRWRYSTLDRIAESADLTASDAYTAENMLVIDQTKHSI